MRREHGDVGSHDMGAVQLCRGQKRYSMIVQMAYLAILTSRTIIALE